MCHQLCQLHSVCGHVTKREIPCDVTASSLKKTRPNPWPTAIDTRSKVKDAFLTWCLKSLKPVTNKAHPLRSTCRPLLTLLHVVEYGFCPMCREYYDKYAANFFRGDGVTKIIGMEMGSGDSAREKAKIERHVDMEKAEERKREKERLKQEKLQQETLEQDGLKEKNIKREKRLEAERFEQERKARKERRHKIRKWLEDKDSIEDDLKKIENTQGRTLIEYEHGKSETVVRVRMSSRPGERGRGPNLGTSHRHERVSGNDDKLDEKPKVHRSRGVSDLVKFFESRSNETETKKEGVRSAFSESPVEKKLPQNCQQDTLGVTEKPAQNQATAKCVNQRPEAQKAAKTNISAPGLQQQPQPVEHKALEPQHRPSLLMSKPKSSTFRTSPGTLQLQPTRNDEVKAIPSVNEPPAVALKCRSQLPANQEDSGHAANKEISKQKLSPANQNKKKELSKGEKNDSMRPSPIRRMDTATPKGTNIVPVHQDSSKKQPDDERETSQIKRKEGHQQTQFCRMVPKRLKETPEIPAQTEGREEPPVTLSKHEEPLQPKPSKPEASTPDPAKETEPQQTPHATRVSREEKKSSTPLIDPAPGNTSLNPSIGSMTVEYDPTEKLSSNDSISSMAVNCDPTDSKVSNPSIDSMAVECDPADSRLSITPVGSMVVEHDSTDSTLSNVSIGSMVVECDSLESIHSIVSNGSMVVEYEPTEGTVSNPSIDSMKAELDSIEQSVLWEDICRHLGCGDGSILAHSSYCMCAKCIRAR
ncbi:hypothetical protein B0T13DRAFT_485373 [Neurospora crassa]|nr:hypothetical protein B0T13DRAFT_485373 [Neurospora crassa]